MDLRWIPRTDDAGRTRRFPIKFALAAGSSLGAIALLSLPANANSYQIALNKVVNGASPAGNGP